MNAFPNTSLRRLGLVPLLCLLALLASCQFAPTFAASAREHASADDSLRAGYGGRADGPVLASLDTNGFGFSAATTTTMVGDPRESGRQAWAPSSNVALPTATDFSEFREQFLQDRLLKREASATIRVSSIEDAITGFETTVESVGGYVVHRTDGNISVRVPSTVFNEIWEGVRGQGEVVTESETTLDVTEEHRDLEIRIRNLRKAHERLLTLLEGADKVEDLLEIEKELRRITLEIERLSAQQQNLTRDVAFSLLEIWFITYDQPVYAQTERSPGDASEYAWIRELGIRNLLGSF
ncbi:MAG: DUF4349 domain-containing protein [Planctomycetota bacterium]